MRILVADDNKKSLYILERLLKAGGYEVVLAGNGAEALERLRTESIDIIVSDVLMPVMDGFRLCKEVKGKDELKNIPFIFYTATYKDEKDEKFALKLGADKYIMKPAEPEKLIKIIQGVVRDVEKGKFEPRKPAFEEEEEAFNLYSERLVNKLEKKMLDLEREIARRQKAKEELQHIEWLLTKSVQPKSAKQKESAYSRPLYGDLTKLNMSGVLKNLVGKDVLIDIVGDYLDLLESSGAVYEKNGDYALGIFASGWCKLLDQASREICNTDDNSKALASGEWHCHESCWIDASKTSIETGRPVDIECNGGIHLFAIPIWARGETIGSINFGYGDPPRNSQKLQEIAKKYKINVNKLVKQAEAYERRPRFIIDIAKSRLITSARLIGSIVEYRLTEEALQKRTFDLGERIKEISCLYEIDEIGRKERLTVEEVLEKAVRIIPPGWQYPEITGSCITFENRKYKTKNFKKTKWMQRVDIIVNAKKAGLVEVCYLKEKPEDYEGPFLKEERNLIDAVVKRLAQTIEHKRAEEEIRASLKEQGVLLQEVHHRVKNNMQLISSLFSLQSRHIKDKQAFEIFKSGQNRVRSMAIIHERFYQSTDFARVDFAEYVQSLTSHLLSSYGINPDVIKLYINIKDAFLDLNTAIPCGLIINELLSNSLKHAFPDDKKGEINIAMRSLKGNEIELIVTDNGVGLPRKVDFRDTETLGLHLAKILAKDQLHGDIKLDRTKGTSFHIKFKVKR
jgi:two-component sensor histidine kinase/CheY-like chemotaxis protein/ligand-binding sensor protein